MFTMQRCFLGYKSMIRKGSRAMDIRIPWLVIDCLWRFVNLLALDLSDRIAKKFFGVVAAL